jgi:RHS repeat-associated protein
MGKEDLLGSMDQLEWFVHMGDNILTEYKQTAGQPSYTLKATNVPGAGTDNHLARVDVLAGNTVSLYLNTAIGSTHRIVNEAGLVLNQEMTNPWGKIVPGYSFADSVPNRYGLTGQEKDAETASTANPTGEMHYRARAYSPRQMRFLQVDPPLAQRAADHYTYVKNRPVSHIDPEGARTYVFKNEERKQIRVITLIAITSGFGVTEAREVAAAHAIARYFARGVQEYWNNKGMGWQVTLNNGNTYTLFFAPYFVAASEKNLNEDTNAGFEDFDWFSYDTGPKSDIYSGRKTQVHFQPGWNAKDHYGMGIDDEEVGRRVVNPRYYARHSGTIAYDTSSEWDLAHEYGHLLGLLERYDRRWMGDRWVSMPDPTPRGAGIMGTPGAYVTPKSLEIQDFLQMVGLTVTSVDYRTKGDRFRNEWTQGIEKAEDVEWVPQRYNVYKTKADLRRVLYERATWDVRGWERVGS